MTIGKLNSGSYSLNRITGSYVFDITGGGGQRERKRETSLPTWQNPTFRSVYAYTGSDQNFVVDSNPVYFSTKNTRVINGFNQQIAIKAWAGGGGGGGSSGWSDGGRGGGGGYAGGTYKAEVGTYVVVVGDKGYRRAPFTTYGGGGRAASGWGPGCGAGLSGLFTPGGTVFSGSTPQSGTAARALLIAGGGGGGGANRNPNSTNGGGGGGTTGANGTSNYGGNAGTGGSQSSTGGSNCTISAGQLRGGDANTPYGAGGGGGWYGGGAGCYQEPLDMGGGGGGSGYISPSITSNLLTANNIQGTNGGPYSIGGFAGNRNDTDLFSLYATVPPGMGGQNEVDGTSGRVVISYTMPKDNIETLTMANANYPTILWYDEGSDCRNFVSNWNFTEVTNMSAFADLDNCWAHGWGGSARTYTLTLNDLPSHTQVRYQAVIHHVDSWDNETNVMYTSNDAGGDITQASWTHRNNVAGVENLSAFNSTSIIQRFPYQYSFSPWGNGSSRGDGYVIYTTNWYNHTSNTFIAKHQTGLNQGSSDEAFYISHVKLWLRQY